MQHVEAQQRRLADRVASQQQLANPRAHQRSVTADVRPHRDGPESELVPGQKIAGERESQGEQEQHHADHPVELSRPLVRPRVKDPAHVEEDADHHAMSTPPVHVAQKTPQINHKLEVLHVLVCLRRIRAIVEHQRHPRGNQNQEEEEGDEPEVKGMLHLEVFFLHFGGGNVEPHVEEDELTLPLVGGQRVGPDDGLPDTSAGSQHHTIRPYLPGKKRSLSPPSPPSRARVTSNHSSGLGAGPCSTTPSALNTEPWQGQWKRSSLWKYPTVQPRCVQTALATAKPFSRSRNTNIFSSARNVGGPKEKSAGLPILKDCGGS